MKPKLVVGLGNALAGDDGIGLEVVEILAQDPRFKDSVDFVKGGTDLLRLSETMRGRELIVLVDAAASRHKVGKILVHEHGAEELDDAQFAAHHLSAIQALNLMRWSDPQIAQARCVWVLITVDQLPNA